MLVLFLLVSPLVIPGSAFNNYFVKSKPIRASGDGYLFPFWFFCHINSSGYGCPLNSGNDIWIAIDYTNDSNATTIIKSFTREVTLKGPHNFQIFFFVGNETLPPGGVEGYCHLNGMAMMVNVV